MARPQKLTPATKRKIYKALKLGATYEAAAGYAGISYQSLLNWKRWGREEKDDIYIDFLAGCEKAEAASQITWLEKIEAAADVSWQAAAWKLERRYPNEYGRQIQQVEHSGPEGNAIPVQFVDYRAGLGDTTETED